MCSALATASICLLRNRMKSPNAISSTNERLQVWRSTTFRVDEPTLENIFVAKLRSFGQEVARDPFPGRHSHEDLRGQVAIGAANLWQEVRRLHRRSKVSNLQVEYGEIYGLLGANGAGKTTTIKMLCGLLGAHRGRSRNSPAKRAACGRREVRQRIGYMSQKFSLYDDLTIEENLEFFAGVYGVPESEREEKRRWVLAFSGLARQENQITGSLPGGWKQRVAFGAAIMHEPSVLFLDEPTSGVDPLARRAFWTMINRLADRGTAILVTTHYLEEAEQCNRLGLMVAGELVAQGTPSGIKSEQSRAPARIHRGPAAARGRSARRKEMNVARLSVRRPAARDHR